MNGSAWQYEQRAAGTDELHRLDFEDHRVRWLRWCRPTDRAIVLGSSQPEELVDPAAARGRGVEVVRRRTGGGAVLVGRGEHVWFDLWLPVGDPLWSDDVTASSSWLARSWVDVLGSFGVEARAHRGRAVAGRFGALVCFAGAAPGEVSIEGRKVVGVSQRRDRRGARFQVAVLQRWAPGEVLDLLRLSPSDEEAARAELPGLATGLEVPEPDLVAAFRAALP